MPALVGTGLYQEDMVFWPSTHSVMANIVPNYINGIVYGCLVEAYCSEHNARMRGNAECNRQCNRYAERIKYYL